MSIESRFDLETTPELERFYLHNNYSEEKHIVTMKQVEEAFAHNPIELTRIQNNKSSVWFLEKIY